MGPRLERDRLTAFLEQGGYESLRAYVARRFPRLADRAEDLIQSVLTELLEAETSPAGQTCGRPSEQSGPVSGAAFQEPYLPLLKQRIAWRALDTLRRVEHAALSALAGDDDEAEGRPRGLQERSDSRAIDPALYVDEAERRQTQVLLLSDILREFVAWCEAPSRKGGTRMKELYERRLRGEEPDRIAVAMGMSRNTADQTLKRAREWILERIRQQDTHQSVFRTLLRGPSPRPVEVSVPLVGVGAVFRSFDDVLRFVVEEMGALCPGPARLAHYLHRPDSEGYSDVRYHVQECGCRHCGEPE